MKRSFFFLAAALVALLPATADAQLLEGVPNAQEYLTFLSGSGQGGAYGVQVGPYSGRFEAWGARGSQTDSFALYCVDFLHSAGNSTGVVNVSSVTGDLDLTRLKDTSRYQRGAYLASLFDAWEFHKGEIGGSLSKANVWGGLHAAIWAATNPPTGGQTLSAGAQTAFDYFDTLADNNAAGYVADDWYVLTRAGATDGLGESGDGKGQEFLVRRASVPEPGTLLLMLTGMVMLVGVSRKRAFDLGSL